MNVFELQIINFRINRRCASILFRPLMKKCKGTTHSDSLYDFFASVFGPLASFLRLHLSTCYHHSESVVIIALTQFIRICFYLFIHIASGFIVSVHLQADYANMKNMQRELQAALDELSGTHCQRLTRYIT